MTLYLSERCNSRCKTCDYWRNGRADLDLAAVSRLLPSLRRLGTRTVVLSGGEPLLNRQWEQIAALLADEGLEVWLLTSGLSLAKYARRVGTLFSTVTVSLDGTDAQTYASIRGVDAFDVVCRGIRAASESGARVTVRVTLQRANFWQLTSFVDLARRLGALQVSFLAVDVANPHAFARHEGFESDLGAACRRPPGARAADPCPGAGSRRGIQVRIHCREPREAAAHPSVLLRGVRTGGLSAGALQCAGVLGRRGCARTCQPVLLHPRADRRSGAQGARRGAESQRYDGAPCLHPRRRPPRVYDLCLLHVAGLRVSGRAVGEPQRVH